RRPLALPVMAQKKEHLELGNRSDVYGDEALDVGRQVTQNGVPRATWSPGRARRSRPERRHGRTLACGAADWRWWPVGFGHLSSRTGKSSMKTHLTQPPFAV